MCSLTDIVFLMQFSIHADGGARGNPGPSGAGAVVRDALGNIVVSVSEFLGHHTNNFAEYEAVILAFTRLMEIVPKTERDTTSVIVKLDSELIVKQVHKEYKVKNPVLKEQYAKLLQCIDAFGDVSFTHVPRAQNKDADALANLAMDRGS